MSKIKVITVCHDPAPAQPLIDSLERNGWDYEVIVKPWCGFGTKLIETFNYLKDHPEVDRFIFCDAFDVICLGDEYEFESKRILGGQIICGAEKGCWPDSSLADAYPKTDSAFKYLNSGLYYAPTKMFMWLINSHMPQFHTDDQEWFTHRFLNTYDIVLDTHQTVFNNHSFIDPTEYGYNNGRIQINGNEPIFIHKNGRTVDPKLDEMLNNLK